MFAGIECWAPHPLAASIVIVFHWCDSSPPLVIQCPSLCCWKILMGIPCIYFPKEMVPFVVSVWMIRSLDRL
ncbi:hypothetical protein vseg_003665 [Gypsophila vaccaria]